MQRLRNLFLHIVQTLSGDLANAPSSSAARLIPPTRASSDCSTPKKPISTLQRKLALAYGCTVIFLILCIVFIYDQSFSSPSSSDTQHSFGFSQWKLINNFRKTHPTAALAPGSHLSTSLPHFSSNGMNRDSSSSSISSGDSSSVSSSNFSSSTGNEVNTEPQVVNPASSSNKLSLVAQKERKQRQGNEKKSVNNEERLKRWVKKMEHCNLFHGKWVRDESYPLFQPGSCPHVDEPFNCLLNGRPDDGYQKYKWKPNNCRIPRLNGIIMLELLRDKRLVFVGDSLNRNMWESLVCILRDSIPDKNKVFEVSGREEFRSESSYSFVFQDYNCSVEFFQSPFLVQEWEMPEPENIASKKETLRIDTIHNSSQNFETADVIIFNTGHWWSHEKTSGGEGYYQEGDHVHDKLDVNTAFRKSLKTWANWVETNIDHSKTSIIFRGYSVSHFKGGEWNSGGKCDDETEPITNRTYLEEGPQLVEEGPTLVEIAESVLQEMKAPVFYLNITEMTNFRRDAHPSFYRGQNMTEAERKSPSMIQDCSHWCLPGVPDTWNEIVYTYLLLKHKKQQQQQEVQQQ